MNDDTSERLFLACVVLLLIVVVLACVAANVGILHYVL